MRYTVCSSDLVWPASAPIELSGTTQLASVVRVKAGFGDRPMTIACQQRREFSRDHLHGHGLDSSGNPVVSWL